MSVQSVISNAQFLVITACSMIGAISIAAKAANTKDMRSVQEFLKQCFSKARISLANAAYSPFVERDREKNERFRLWADVFLGYGVGYFMVLYAILIFLQIMDIPRLKAPWYAIPVILLVTAGIMAYAFLIRNVGHRAEWKLREMKKKKKKEKNGNEDAEDSK